jgi:hypothetical protein
VHEVAAQVFVTAWQKPGTPTSICGCTQSTPLAHGCPTAHFVTHVPPQSMALSLPLSRPSLHWSAAQRLVPPHAPLWQSELTAHTRVAAHFGSQEPPQSTSVSLPLRTPSKHWLGTQRSVVALHTPEAQSVLPAHRLFTAQRRDALVAPQVPPQSTSVSEPTVSTPSSQGPATQVREPVLQTFDAQSPLTAQPREAAQRAAQVEPPQSTSVSVPLRTRSRQASETQRLPTHRFDAQSLGTVQDRPVPQAWAPQTPPQSTSASVASFTPLKHGPLMHWPFAHEPLTQSEAREQVLPTPHFTHMGPPQSVLVSAPFSTPSSQPGSAQRSVRG